MKKKLVTLLTAISATVLMITPVFATQVSDMKTYETYDSGDYTCSTLENADLTKTTISYEAGDKKGTFDLKKVTSVGLKKLENTTYFASDTEKDLENPIYVLNNNINTKCKYVPVYEVTGKEDGKNKFVLFGYYESSKVYSSSDSLTEMGKVYQSSFALADEDITEDGTDYYQISLPDMETLELNLEKDYVLKNWEYSYSKDKGAYFRANILPTDTSKIATVKFYTLDETGKSVLTKTQEVEIGKAAIAPVIDGEWDVDFTNVQNDLEVKQISSTAKTTNTSTSTQTTEEGKEETPSTGDASNILWFVSIMSIGGFLLLNKKKIA